MLFSTFSLAFSEESSSPYLLKELSDDWTDFQFQLENQVYQLPLPVSIFLENGWTLEDDEELLSPNMVTFSRKLSKDHFSFDVRIINLGIDVLPAAECLIGGFSIKEEDLKEGISLSVSQNASFGKTKEEILTLFGTPGYVYEATNYEKAEYKLETYCTLVFYYDSETQKVITIEMQNYTTPQGYNDVANQAEVEVPQEVIDYQADSALGDDIFSFNVKVDDVVYTLPAPCTYFEENGWKLAEKSLVKLPAKDSKGRIPLLYDGGFTVNTRFINPTDKGNILQNCFVAALIFEENFPGKVEFPGGITIGMAKGDLEKAIEGFALTEEEVKIEESKSYTSFSLRKKVLEDVNIYVNNETNLVYKIEINNTTINRK